VNDRDWQRDLEQFLERRFLALSEVSGSPMPRSRLVIAPPLDLREAKYFLLGLEEHLFEVSPEGHVQSPMLRVVSQGETKDSTCRIFCDGCNPPRLFREGICQLATAAALVLERGWLTTQIEIDPPVGEIVPTADRIDLAIRSTSGDLFAVVEVKRSAPELAKLARDFPQCCRRGAHRRDDCGFPQNHVNYDFCAFYKPSYFWAVAPGGEICFRLFYGQNDTIQLEQLDFLPPRSVIEMQARG
jgi:hypothetical protein